MPTFISFICDFCKKDSKKDLRHFNDNTKRAKNRFCSRVCANTFGRARVDTKCTKCDAPVVIQQHIYNNSKTKRFFCNSSCAASYNNQHKSFGSKRSKLEQYIEIKLLEDFPSLKFKFNSKDAIGAELDVYCEELNLAIELNGIVHYEPIWGIEKLERVRNLDKQKMIECYNRGIELIVINSASHKYITAKTCDVYYQEVNKIFNSRLQT